MSWTALHGVFANNHCLGGLGGKHNVFVERFRGSVKYEEVYLRDYQTVQEARAGLGCKRQHWLAGNRQHSVAGTAERLRLK